MSANSEATRLNLEYYRKQSKALLRAVQSGNPEALERLSRQLPKFIPSSLALHDAQLTIAREQGFPSWPRFRAFLIQSALDYQGLVAVFIEAAVSDLGRAAEILASHPEIAGAGFYAALVIGDAERVERALTGNPALVAGRGGPRNYGPLAYVCSSRFAGRASTRAGGIVETARILLRHGADPNASVIAEAWPDNPLSCLYAATGLNNNAALARLLLEAGANPNDSESLYHSTEHPDLVCMKLLLHHGATAAGTNALKHILDREDLEGLRLLLAAGADPNEVNGQGQTALHWAVGRGRSVAAITALLDSGADLDAQRKDGRTAYAMAVQGGQTGVSSLLQARGAQTNISALDRFLGACETAGAKELEALLSRPPEIVVSPESKWLLADLTMSHRTAAVRGLLAAGLPVDSRGDSGATALHWACWKGYSDIVGILLNHGASLTIEDRQFHGTPPGWFGHGVRNCGEDGGDYPGVARLLIAASAKIPTADLPTGRPEVDEILREHGLI